MKIAIVGAGHVGAALGSGFLKRNHEVIFGVRDVKKTDSATNAQVASVMEAAQSADVLVLAVPWPAVGDALKSAGDLTGKILIDATNPFLPDLSGLDPQVATSGGEMVASLVPGALVVKMFNSTGAGNMANPDYHGHAATMFYCGDDDGANKIAAGLARDLGFAPVDAGPLSRARMLEGLALFWVTLAFKQGFGVNFVLNLVRR